MLRQTEMCIEGSGTLNHTAVLWIRGKQELHQLMPDHVVLYVGCGRISGTRGPEIPGLY